MALVPLTATFDGPPPHNADAERAVLGSILIEPRSLDRVLPLLKSGDFFRRAHQLIFQSMIAMSDEGTPIDLLTVRATLKRERALQEAGGSAYVASLVDQVPDIANVERYAGLVRDQALLRELMTVGVSVAKDASAGDRPADIVTSAEKKMLEIASRGTSGQLQAVRSLLGDAVRYAESQHAAGGRPTGIVTGYPELDGMTGGLQRQDLVVLAARPAMGKTSLMLNLAEGIAVPILGREPNGNVAIFSLEMSAMQLILRLLSSQALVPGPLIRSGLLTEPQWKAIGTAAERLSRSSIWIDDTPGIDLPTLRSRARQLKRTHGLDVVMVDYLQLMAAKEKTESRNVEIGQISRGLKILAKELDVCVVALAQLSRRPEQRKKDHRPQTADLRDSGSIEQDADVVMFIYRDEVYDSDSADRGLAEIIVAKHRNGPTGTTKLVFRNDVTKFFSYARA